VAEWIVAVSTGHRALLAGAMEDRLHQPARARAYPYLYEMIAAARKAGALGAALSGAGGSVIAIADKHTAAVGAAMKGLAGQSGVVGRVLELRASAAGAKLS
jgi:homoserine kinase